MITLIKMLIIAKRDYEEALREFNETDDDEI